MPNFAEKLDEILVRFIAKFNYIKYVDSLQLNGNEKILELGCGAGNLSRFVSKKLSWKGSLTCIDISDYWLSRAKKRMRKFNNIEYKLGDISKLNLRNFYYDIVIIHYVLHDINFKYRLKTIKILKNKLKDSGKIYIREPTRKKHGMSVKEINNLILSSGLKNIFSKQNYSLLLKNHYLGEIKKIIK